MPDEQKLYPRGRIALGSGDLIQVTNVRLDHTNNAKQVHTLHTPGAGVVDGVVETTVSFDIALNEDGPERDYVELVKKRLIKQVRIKVPGLTINVQGRVQSLGMEIPVDSEIKQTVTFVGKWID